MLVKKASMIFSILLLATGVTKSHAESVNYLEAFRQISEPQSAGRGIIKAPFSIRKDAGLFKFEQGEIFFFKPLGGAVNAAYFKGLGRLSYEPPLMAEKDQLLRFYKTSMIERDFSEMLMFFDDSTYGQFSSSLDIDPKVLQKPEGGRIDFFLRYIRERKGKYYPTSLMKAVLDGDGRRYFWAGIKTEDTHPLFFEIDPLQFEEVRFSRGRSANVIGEYTEVINQFPEGTGNASSVQRGPAASAPFRMESYSLDCAIANNLKTGIRCKMVIRSQLSGQNWIFFRLAGNSSINLEVDSVKWGDRPADFYKDKENNILWVQCPEKLNDGQTYSLEAFYRGDILDKYYNWLSLKESIYWYPHGDYRDKTDFDVTFHYPEKYSLVCVGQNVSLSKEGDMVTSRWTTSRPVRNFTFNLGFFKEYKMKEKNIPPVTILLNETAREDFQREVAAQGGSLTIGRDMKKQVGADIVNSIAFYQKVYGQCPVEEFVVSESPYWGGEAFPGMVNLSTNTFQNTSNQGYDEILRAHEVAHQWWGHGLDFESYHDQWLSEGLAEFSGLWYMQTVLKNNKLYFTSLEKRRDAIMDARKYLLSSGLKPGAIWLGYRSSTSDTEDDFGLLVYYKGAWVIQMLRNMMLDLNTMSEDKFVGAMNEFYSGYCGKTASTEDFKKVMEKHCGQNLDWFFNQWVYGDNIPEYKFSYTAVQTPEGKFKLTYRIDQSGVPDNFQMIVPLQFDFGNGQMARTRVVAKGARTQNTLLLPMKPKEVAFNPFASVLCKCENVSYSD